MHPDFGAGRAGRQRAAARGGRRPAPGRSSAISVIGARSELQDSTRAVVAAPKDATHSAERQARRVVGAPRAQLSAWVKASPWAMARRCMGRRVPVATERRRFRRCARQVRVAQCDDCRRAPRRAGSARPSGTAAPRPGRLSAANVRHPKGPARRIPNSARCVHRFLAATELCDTLDIRQRLAFAVQVKVVAVAPDCGPPCQPASPSSPRPCIRSVGRVREGYRVGRGRQARGHRRLRAAARIASMAQSAATS